ncbi:hypothetical protein GCM10028808_53830 [Spirosoma migulaei]
MPKHANEIDGIILSARWSMTYFSKNIASDLQQTIDYLHKLKIKTVVIGQSEVYNISFSTIAAKEYHFEANLSQKFISQDSYNTNKILKSKIKDYYIDIFNLQHIPKLSKELIPYMFDENHFTPYGAKLITKDILANEVFIQLLNSN